MVHRLIRSLAKVTKNARISGYNDDVHLMTFVNSILLILWIISALEKVLEMKLPH